MDHSDHSSSFSRALRTPQTVRNTSNPDSTGSDTRNAAASTSDDFARRIVGGKLVRSENGTLVIQASGTEGNLQPIGLTTDAIITSSVLNKLGTQPRLKADGFEVTSSNGVVSIHARNDSIDDAVAVINLILTVPDVRRVVYELPTRT
jgi:osmotically-inducible protein OsmY